MLRAETASLKMKHRIWKQKLILVRRIQIQDRSLAKAIYEEQVAMGWPGLAREASEICKILCVPDINTRLLEKEEVEDAVFNHHYKEMKEEMETYSKLKEVKQEDYRKEQEYMKEKAVDRARMAFKIRTKMVKNVKGNFKNMFKNNLMCEECEEGKEETQEHLMVCPGWREELGSLDVTGIQDRVEFFTRIMKRKAT